MKYLSILLVIMACSHTPSGSASVTTPTPAASAEEASKAVQDSIVPAQYQNGKLVKIEKTEEQWKQLLSPEEYRVLRKEGTERAFTGDLWNHHEHGIYICAACGLPLFASDTKFDSGTGWPSYYKPIQEDCIADKSDTSLGMDREEVECARCGGHLGHVFPDGPPPTGLRYCINSVSLNFVKN